MACLKLGWDAQAPVGFEVVPGGYREQGKSIRALAGNVLSK